MHSMLFAATIPSNNDVWETFLGRVAAKTKDAKSMKRLAENVWLVNLIESPGPLGYLISFAHETKVAYGLLPFEREPQWLPSGFDPKPI